MSFSRREILSAVRMVAVEHLDVRTVTLALNLRDCADPDAARAAEKVHAKIVDRASRLREVVAQLEGRFGVKVANRRVSLTPLSEVLPDPRPGDYVVLAKAVDDAARIVGVDFIGGCSALVHRGVTDAARVFLGDLPACLAGTDHVCGSLSLATSRTGINMDAVANTARLLLDMAERTRDRGGLACAKFVAFANPVDDNPFMAGAFHGAGQGEALIHVGVSGPGVVLEELRRLGPAARLDQVAETIKHTAFRITRAGELFGREAAAALGVPFGIVDLSLAPTPVEGDSVGAILEEMGLAQVGAPGSTAALALLTDAVKKGGAMASSHVGGLSGAFIPVSEDAAMIRAAADGALTLEKLEAMTSVCSVGLDMIAVPGDTPAETLAALIADEMAIGVVNHKTTAVRIIPAPGKRVGEVVAFGGLLGEAPVMAISAVQSRGFVRRGGFIPAPLTSLRN